MEPSKAAMKAALRVLTALSERQEPDQGDVDELHWYAPSDSERPIDELVCDAIQRALKDREEKRKALQGRQGFSGMAMTARQHDAASAGVEVAERSAEMERLLREHRERQLEYQELSAKLQRLGAAFQQAFENNSEAARANLESAAGEVDITAIRQLLDRHARLARQLIADAQIFRR